MNTETLETQVVVVGGGGAGLAAAVTAAGKGVDVIVLEKRRKLGGNTAMAHDIFAAESPPQQRKGLDVLRDDCFKIAMGYAHWRIDPRLVRVWIDKSGDTIRWLEGKGITFNVGVGSRKFLNGSYPPTGHLITSRRGGALVIEALAKECEELGVRVLCETAVKELITDGEGRVIGVLATQKGGEPLRIMAKGVIVATGGYGGNKKLLKKYNPYYSENIKLVGAPCMGEGLLMATKVGAATEGLGTLHVEAACYIPGEPSYIHGLSMEPKAIWVNEKGERFVDESVMLDHWVFESAWAIVRQPGRMCYTILDGNLIQSIIESGPTTGWIGFRSGVSKPRLAKIIESAVGRGNAKVADSLDRIAEWIGAKPEVMKATVDEYNSYCDQGRDKIFAKDPRCLVPLRTPPYYAVKFHPRNLGTIGGIKINYRMEVLDQEDNPICGLYAAGQDAGGWQPEVYNQILAGSAFSFAINSGRIVGENTADYVLGD
jgi:fumarate reductase flavoprotein subunit